jgi:hypothetical protein
MQYLPACEGTLQVVTHTYRVTASDAPTATETFLSCAGTWVPLDSGFIAGVFDADAAALGFVGVVALWAVGFAVGVVINQLRKMR